MIHPKEQLHGIGNYLTERFGLLWYVISSENCIYFSGIDVKVTKRSTSFEVSSMASNTCKAVLLSSPMQVINYIITRKYEVK